MLFVQRDYRFIQCWRGDIPNRIFTLTLVNTATNQEYRFPAVRDVSTSPLYMVLDVRLAFQDLPAGEYAYELRATELLATGLLQYDMGFSVLTTEYNRDITYVEYNR